jgi:hypothetical protein
MTEMAMRYLALVLLLGGCSGSVVLTAPDSVIVRHGWAGQKETQVLAEAECMKTQRHARFRGRLDPEMPHYIYDCVS